MQGNRERREREGDRETGERRKRETGEREREINGYIVLCCIYASLNSRLYKRSAGQSASQCTITG